MNEEVSSNIIQRKEREKVSKKKRETISIAGVLRIDETDATRSHRPSQQSLGRCLFFSHTLVTMIPKYSLPPPRAVVAPPASVYANTKN